jgi:polyisoprenoid-binding protein YceI
METMTVTRANPSTIIAPSATVWRVDPVRSKAEFSVGNRLLLLIKFTVDGQFSDVSGTITLVERDLTRSRADLVIGTASIDAGIARRDKHLKSADFFDVEQYPLMTFTSRRVGRLDAAAGRYRVVGDLMLRGVTRPVTLDVSYTAPRPNTGERRISLTGTTTISQRDFGMDHQSPVGGPADEIRIRVAIEATPTSSAGAPLFSPFEVVDRVAGQPYRLTSTPVGARG